MKAKWTWNWTQHAAQAYLTNYLSLITNDIKNSSQKRERETAVANNIKMHNNLNKDISERRCVFNKKEKYILRCDHRSTTYTPTLDTQQNTWKSSPIIIASQHKSVIGEGSRIQFRRILLHLTRNSRLSCLMHSLVCLVSVLSCTCKCKWVDFSDWLCSFSGVTRMRIPLNNSICLLKPTAIGQLNFRINLETIKEFKYKFTTINCRIKYIELVGWLLFGTEPKTDEKIEFQQFSKLHINSAVMERHSLDCKVYGSK